MFIEKTLFILLTTLLSLNNRFCTTTPTPSGAQAATMVGWSAFPWTRIHPNPEKTMSVLSLMVNS